MPALPLRSRDEVLFGGKRNKKDPPPTAEIEAAMQSFDDTAASADDCKAIGNLCYQHEMYSAATHYYTKAVERCAPGSGAAVHLSNRSAAYLNSPLLAGASLALKDALKAIELHPTWFKGYVRKADALFVQVKLEAASSAYQEALARNPGCSIAAESLVECRARMERGDGPTTAGGGGKQVPHSYSECNHPGGGGTRSSGQHPPNMATTPTSLEDGRLREAPPVAPRNPELPTSDETNAKIASWSAESPVDLNATATKKYKASVADADRELGRTVREQMMGQYRNKLSSDEWKREQVLKEREEEKLRGAGFDYRAASDAQQRRKEYSKGTDEVGHAISADCYKSYASPVNERTW